jgi:penicillin-binding protein 1A
LIVGFFVAIWRVLWGIAWRATAIGALILGGIVFYFYAQMPPITELVDGRARGSVTMQDRNGEVFAWRGETFGVISADTVAPDLHDAVVATEDKRFYWHFGISPRGIASAIRINLSEGRGPLDRPSPSRLPSCYALACAMTRRSGSPRPTTKRTAVRAASGAS